MRGAARRDRRPRLPGRPSSPSAATGTPTGLEHARRRGLPTFVCARAPTIPTAAPGTARWPPSSPPFEPGPGRLRRVHEDRRPRRPRRVRRPADQHPSRAAAGVPGGARRPRRPGRRGDGDGCDRARRRRRAWTPVRCSRSARSPSCPGTTRRACTSGSRTWSASSWCRRWRSWSTAVLNEEEPPMSDRIPIRRALLGVYDKTGIEELAAGLAAAGVELVSTGATARRIAEAGIPVTPGRAGHRLPRVPGRPGEDAAPRRARGDPGRPAQARARRASSRSSASRRSTWSW